MTSLELPIVSTDDERWNVVAARESRADILFVYGVKTTGVFCRPGCPARLPKRQNVRFFATSEEAEAAGFRACRRCSPSESSLHRHHALLIQRACELIAQSEAPPSLERIAEHVGLSRYHFHRLFKRHVGITPKEYATACQLERLKTSLEQGTPIIQAIYDAGFSSTSRLYERATRELGMTPARFKTGASGVIIRYAITHSSLGHVLVAMTDKGICTIDFGSSPGVLRDRLRTRFPGATMSEGDAALGRLVERLIRFTGTPEPGIDLPPEIRGTAFQRMLLKALQRLPADPADDHGHPGRGFGWEQAELARAVLCPPVMLNPSRHHGRDKTGVLSRRLAARRAVTL